MKNKNEKKPASNKVAQAFTSDSDKEATVTVNKKHHQKPKKQYL